MSENKPPYKVVFAKCRRGNDQLTTGQSCESNQAYNLSEPHSHLVRMKCVKCGFTWSVNVGGFTSH